MCILVFSTQYRTIGHACIYIEHSLVVHAVCCSVPCVDWAVVQVASSLAVGWCSTGLLANDHERILSKTAEDIYILI